MPGRGTPSLILLPSLRTWDSGRRKRNLVSSDLTILLRLHSPLCPKACSGFLWKKDALIFTRKQWTLCYTFQLLIPVSKKNLISAKNEIHVCFSLEFNSELSICTAKTMHRFHIEDVNFIIFSFKNKQVLCMIKSKS